MASWMLVSAVKPLDGIGEQVTDTRPGSDNWRHFAADCSRACRPCSRQISSVQRLWQFRMRNAGCTLIQAVYLDRQARCYVESGSEYRNTGSPDTNTTSHIVDTS